MECLSSSCSIVSPFGIRESSAMFVDDMQLILVFLNTFGVEADVL